MTYWLYCIVWLVSAHRWLRSGFISFCISSVNTLKKNKLHADQLAAPSDLQSPVRPQSTEFHVKNENDTKQTNSIGKPKKNPSRIHVYERFILFRRLKPRRWVGGASARCTISIFLYVFCLKLTVYRISGGRRGRRWTLEAQSFCLLELSDKWWMMFLCFLLQDRR